MHSVYRCALSAMMEQAQAIVVVLSPDDEVKLKPQFSRATIRQLSESYTDKRGLMLFSKPELLSVRIIKRRSLSRLDR